MRHIKGPLLVLLASIAIGGMAMSMEARGDSRPLTLQHEAGCYALAAAAGYRADAAYHRMNLKTYRTHQSNEVDYYIGFRLGYLTATTEALGAPLNLVAASEYDHSCQERA